MEMKSPGARNKIEPLAYAFSGPEGVRLREVQLYFQEKNLKSRSIFSEENLLAADLSSNHQMKTCCSDLFSKRYRDTRGDTIFLNTEEKYHIISL